MIWYSPLLPLLLGMLFLALSALLHRRCLALLGLVLILPAYALMTLLGANLLVLVIEHRTSNAETAPACDQVQAAVLLSGGLSRPAQTSDDFGALTAETLARIFAWRHRQSAGNASDLPLIIAGGGPFRVPEAEVMGALLQLLAAADGSLRLERGSLNTAQSAQAVRELLDRSVTRITLATSALHLPRATFAFERAGFDVCPLALNRHYMAVSGWTTLLPQSSSLAKSESALHEVLGEIFYRLRQGRAQPRQQSAFDPMGQPSPD